MPLNQKTKPNQPMDPEFWKEDIGHDDSGKRGEDRILKRGEGSQWFW